MHYQAISLALCLLSVMRSALVLVVFASLSYASTPSARDVSAKLYTACKNPGHVALTFVRFSSSVGLYLLIPFFRTMDRGRTSACTLLHFRDPTINSIYSKKISNMVSNAGGNCTFFMS